jgi:hypothetical protein
MALVGQERLATRDRLQNSTLPLPTQILRNRARLGHVADQRLRAMRRQVVGHEDPTRPGVGRHGSRDVGREVLLGPRRLDCRGDQLTGRHLESCR